MGPSWDLHGTFMEPSWNLHGAQPMILARISKVFEGFCNLHGTFMGPSWDLHGTFMDLHGTFMGPSWNLHGTSMEPPWAPNAYKTNGNAMVLRPPWNFHGTTLNLHGTPMGPSWTFMEPSWDLDGMEPSWDLHGTFMRPLRNLHGRQMLIKPIGKQWFCHLHGISMGQL